MLLHAAALWWWPVAKQDRPRPMVLEVEFASQPPSPAEQVRAEVQQPLPEEPPPAPVVPQLPPEIAEIVAPPHDRSVESEPAARDLNMERPTDWKKIIESTMSAADAKIFAFAPDLQAGVAARRETRRTDGRATPRLRPWWSDYTK